MNKICLLTKNIEELKIDVDSLIIGLKNFNSLNTLELELDDIKNFININKEIYISINKLISNNEIDELTCILKYFDNKNIKGIIFDDISVYQIVKENNLNINLIWGNIHQTTSYNSINTWYDLGVNKALTSPDITLNEIIEIKNNTNSELFVPLYGMFEIFSSRRFLISSYFDYINQKKEDNLYYINNKIINENYPIYEDKSGTHIINGTIMNGLDEYVELLNNNVENILINSYMIDNINEVVDNFKVVRDMHENNNIDIEKIKELSSILGNNKGFLNKETIYKVKSGSNE